MNIQHTVSRALVALSLVLASVGLSIQSVSANSDRYSQLHREETRNYKNDASSAAAQAQARYGGKVLNVSKSTVNGRTVYRVKLLLDSGRIKIVTIPE